MNSLAPALTRCPRFASLWMVALLVAWTLPASLARADSSSSDCLDCHDGEESVVTFADGATLSVVISEASWNASGHAAEVKCQECHPSMTDTPHPAIHFASRRAYQLDRAGACKKCHFAYHNRAQDSIHAKELAKGNTQAPTCTDCHGVHDATDRADRLTVTARCARCHDKAASQYARSAHGKALSELTAGGKATTDVPVCTDCHGTHAMADPRKAAFHVSSWSICSKCHGDKAKMAPYGLSTAVVETYLDDFHGRSNERYAQGAGSPVKPIATCTDCHGVHDVVSLRQAKREGQLRDQVIVACRKCHKEAPLGFADAWLAHEPPSPGSAPLVWGVQWGYRILIPLIMSGLLLHILLHLWRARVHR